LAIQTILNQKMLDLQRYSAYLDEDIESSQEPRLQQLYDYALRFLEGETHRYFGPVTQKEEYKFGSGYGRLWLLEAPVNTGSGDLRDSVFVSKWIPGLVWEDVEDFDVRGRLLIRMDGAQWLQIEEYKIVYEAGYDQLPDDIEREVFELMRYSIRNLEQMPGVKTERLGDYRYELGEMTQEPWSPRLNQTINRWAYNP